MIFEVIFWSILFGGFVKLTDLANEHGLKLFNGDSIIFTLIASVSAIFLFFQNNLLIGFYLAFSLMWFIRGKIDRPTHFLGFTIIFFIGIILIIQKNIIINFFMGSLAVLLIIGFFNDKIVKKTKYKKASRYLYLFYPLILVILDPRFILVFISYLFFEIGYEGITNLYHHNQRK